MKFLPETPFVTVIIVQFTNFSQNSLKLTLRKYLSTSRIFTLMTHSMTNPTIMSNIKIQIAYDKLQNRLVRNHMLHVRVLWKLFELKEIKKVIICLSLSDGSDCNTKETHQRTRPYWKTIDRKWMDIVDTAKCTGFKCIRTVREALSMSSTDKMSKVQKPNESKNWVIQIFPSCHWKISWFRSIL